MCFMSECSMHLTMNIGTHYGDQTHITNSQQKTLYNSQTQQYNSHTKGTTNSIIYKTTITLGLF